MAADKPGNQTPDTPDVSETELRATKVDELREQAKDASVQALSKLRKDGLVEAISDKAQYSQEITSLDEEPERDGRSLVASNHEVIRTWAEDRGVTPATVEGTEHGDHVGVLRFDFGGGSDNLRHCRLVGVHTFDARELSFIYQESRSDGRPSNFCRLESPHREDA